MKNMPVGTFICCLFLSFVLGFLMCHKLYSGLFKERYDFSNTGRNNSSLHW
jgi:hypothetical protein